MWEGAVGIGDAKQWCLRQGEGDWDALVEGEKYHFSRAIQSFTLEAGSLKGDAEGTGAVSS